VVAQVRAVEPRPGDEPDWAAMQRYIERACDELDHQQAASWRGRLSRWLRPRYALGLAGLAAAGAAVILFVHRGDEPAPRDRSVASTQVDAGVGPVRVVPKETVDLRAADVSELAPAELDRVLETLGPERLVETAAGEDSVLDPEIVAEWTGSDPVNGEDPLGVGLFSDPDFDGLIQNLDEEQLDRVEQALAKAKHKAG
jgi:hypothetical protein